MPILRMTKNYLHEYIFTLYLANNKRPDPSTGDATQPVILMGGGSRCFSGDTLIKTNVGSKRISDLTVDDSVLSYNHKKGSVELKGVKRVFKNEDNKKKCYRIRFKNGDEIDCTEDHEIFYRGRYVCAKDLVYLHKLLNTP